MAETAVAQPFPPVVADRAVATASAPWPLYAVVFASTCVVIGGMWDISWHRTIGRDTFWTPAHLAIYLGGVLSGLTCGWLALTTTFGGSAEARAASVRFWGFRAPFGAWVCIWGAIAMVTSAPFDDWWHNAYGLDVRIISPPHIVLAAGIASLQFGAMMMTVAWQNRAVGDRRLLARLYLLAAGLVVLLASTVAMEYTQRWAMHRSLFYQVTAGVFVFLLVSTARASVVRWPATITALIYSVINYVMLLILPLFAAQPLLGPIYVPIDRMMPPDFPLLLVVPAIGIDLVMARLAGVSRRRFGDWLVAAALAVVFVAMFFAAQYPFADFLMSEWARNDFFGSHRMGYATSPAMQERFYRINPPDDLVRGLAFATLVAFVSARVALYFGNWMSRVRR
jgi:hypothetical protein